MTKNQTQSIQDYLKAIYDLAENGNFATTTALAARLGIAPPSVTEMVQRLSKGNPPLVNYQKHQGVSLTSQGKLAALEVIRHHRLIETYLVTALGYPWDKVHTEADQLEHFISEDFEERIATFLGNPIRDPHGELIPTADLTMPPDTTLLLSSLRPNQKAAIIRVHADNPDLLRHLGNLGLIPCARVTAIDFSPFDQNLSIHIEGQVQEIVIGSAISDHIFVELITPLD